jgi:hypothetical protein
MQREFSCLCFLSYLSQHRKASRLYALLVQNTEDHLRFMGFLMDFVRPRLGEVSTDDTRQLLFGPIETIRDAERHLHDALVHNPVSELAGVLEASLRPLEGAYTTYIKQHAKSSTVFDNAMQRDEPFASEVKEVASSPEAAELIGGISVSDLLQLSLYRPHAWLWFVVQIGKHVPSVAAMTNAVRECVSRITHADGSLPPDSAAALRAIDNDVQPDPSIRARLKQKLWRRTNTPVAQVGRIMLREGEIRYILPRAPGSSYTGTLHLCNDVLMLRNTATRIMQQKMDIRNVIVSPRHEPRVGDDIHVKEGSFSLFWNRGQGRLEHFVLVAPGAEQRHAWLRNISEAVSDRVNDLGASKVQYHVVRERKPGLERCNEYGAAYHFMIWGFGSKTMYRCDADNGALISTYRCSELESFEKIETREKEVRLLVRTTWETFELSTVGVVPIILSLRNIMR